MSEQLQLRTEHSRSIEDAEKYRALATLKEVGLLIPLSDVETYHGRLGYTDSQSEWQVDPTFANGGNDSGNGNVNARSSLYTGDKDIAQDFAKERLNIKVRPEYKKVFEERVRNYTPAERKEWLERRNIDQQKWWANLEPEIRKYYPDGNTPLSEEDLDSRREQSAEARSLEKRTPMEEKRPIWNELARDYHAEVHELASFDTDASVIDASFDVSKLDESTRAKYFGALRTLAIPMSEGSPIGFEDRGAFQPFARSVTKLNKYTVALNELADVAEDAGLEYETVRQLASAYNARRISEVDIVYLARRYMDNPTDIATLDVKVGEESRDLPINFEYVQNLFRAAHIVGVKQGVNSATLGGRDISTIALFDLERVATVKDLESQRHNTWKALGALAGAIKGPQLGAYETGQQHELLKSLTDVHAKPEQLVAAAKKVEGYDVIFDADAGNWEGYTLGEHTETVLRNFDTNYADTLPVELLGPMRLAILAHDVGKPEAAANGEKHKQKEYNATQAKDFYDKLGIDERLRDLLLAVIGEGAELAFQVDVKRVGESAEQELKLLAKDTMQKFIGSEVVPDEQVEGFISMCKILQICDGGAYTSMAVTRKERGHGRHRNAPSFNATFAQPVGFGKHTIRLRREGEPAAARDLTPKRR